MDYTVLTYNIGGYEVMHEIGEKSDRAEYLYITDDPTITSSTWNVVCVENPHKEDPFELCYDIRFNPFRFAHTDTIIRLDGSVIINKSLDPLIDLFNAGGFDLSLCVHPTRSNLYDEYVAWVIQRGYSKTQAERILNFLWTYEGYDPHKDFGLYQYNYMIQKKDKKVLASNEMTLSFLHYLAEEGKMVERVDQTVGSFVLNKYFSDLRVLPVGEDLFHGEYLTWCQHGTSNPLLWVPEEHKPILFGKEVTTLTL